MERLLNIISIYNGEMQRLVQLERDVEIYCSGGNEMQLYGDLPNIAKRRRFEMEHLCYVARRNVVRPDSI